MKKNPLKTVSSLVLVLTLVLSLGSVAFAETGSVAYEGGAEKFVFAPGSDVSPTDLFANFKGVMPGDTLTQTIEVKNDFKGCDHVKIYLRAEEIAAEAANDTVTMAQLLSQLTMTVKNGDTVIYTASPDGRTGLKENVLLGDFRPGKGATLTVELSVPLSLSNEYAEALAKINWVFTAEQINDPTPVPASPVVTSPQTGDGANMGLWLGLGGMALAGLCGLGAMRLWRNRKQ